MPYSSAARTNLTSREVRISNRKLGEGSFRECFEDTYVGGNRNNQEAACKRFKPKFRSMEHEYFDNDFEIADTAIGYAEGWNCFCDYDEEILITKGNLVGQILRSNFDHRALLDHEVPCEQLWRSFAQEPLLQSFLSIPPHPINYFALDD